MYIVFASKRIRIIDVFAEMIWNQQSDLKVALTSVVEMFFKMTKVNRICCVI